MVLEPRSSRSLLQRRSSVSNAIQAGLDGIAVTGIAWYLIYDQFGYITSDYVIMLLLLIGALAVIYDHYAIYRTNVGLSIKAFRLSSTRAPIFRVLSNKPSSSMMRMFSSAAAGPAVQPPKVEMSRK